MAGHAELKFVMAECSKTQIRLTRSIFSCCLTKEEEVETHFDTEVYNKFSYENGRILRGIFLVRKYKPKFAKTNQSLPKQTKVCQFAKTNQSFVKEKKRDKHSSCCIHKVSLTFSML